MVACCGAGGRVGESCHSGFLSVCNSSNQLRPTYPNGYRRLERQAPSGDVPPTERTLPAPLENVLGTSQHKVERIRNARKYAVRQRSVVSQAKYSVMR